MKLIDHKKSINIAIESILESMRNGKEEIFLITEQIDKENRDVKADIEEIKNSVKKYTNEIKILKEKELKSREKLLLVSSDFVHYTHDDIKLAYEDALSLQKTLIEKQSEINSILNKLSSFEKRIQTNNELIVKADELLSKIEIISDYIKIDVSETQSDNTVSAKWILYQEKEKSRIARDIHDGPAQTIASLVIKSDILKKLLEKQAPQQAISKELDQLKIQLRSVIKEIRRIMYDLRPTSLDELGLLSSVEGLASKIKEDNGIEFKLKLEEKMPLKSPTLRIICFRVIQESLNNIVKHSKAKKVELRLIIKEDIIHIYIKDNGIGFDIDEVEIEKSFGISSLKERVSLAQGTIDIISAKNKGTSIDIKIPNKEDEYA